MDKYNITIERRQRKFKRLATSATFASLLSYAFVFTITPASLNEIGRQYHASSADLAWLFRLLMSGFFVAVLGASRYSDKHGRLHPLLFGCIAMSVGLILFAVSPNFGVALAAMFIAGIGGGASEGPATALLSDLYSGAKRTAVMNWSQAVFGLGAVATPLAIGKLIESGMDWHLGYLAAGILAALSVGLVLAAASMRMELPSVHPPNETGGWRIVAFDHLVLWLALGIMLYVAAEGGPANWLAVYFRRDLIASDSLAASSLAFFWLGILLGRIVAACFSGCVSDPELVRGCAVLSAILQAVLLLLHSLVPAVVAVFALGICLGPIWPTIASLAGSAYPRQSGTVLGIVIASGSLGAAIFPPIIGWLAVFTGMRIALWLCFLLLIFITILFTKIRGLCISRLGSP